MLHKLFEKDVDALEEVILLPHVGRIVVKAYGDEEFNISVYTEESTHSDRELIYTAMSVGKEMVLEFERAVDGMTIMDARVIGTSGHATTGERGYVFDDSKAVTLIPNGACTVVYYED